MPLYGPMAENNCFHAWHSQGREKAWGATCRRYVTPVDRGRGAAALATEHGSTRISVGGESSSSGTESGGSSSSGGASDGDVKDNMTKSSNSDGD